MGLSGSAFGVACCHSLVEGLVQHSAKPLALEEEVGFPRTVNPTPE